MPRWWATTVSCFFVFFRELFFFIFFFLFLFTSFVFFSLTFPPPNHPLSTEANWPGTPWGRYGNASEDSGGECGVPFFARVASPGDERSKPKNGSSSSVFSAVTSNGPSTFSASPWWSLEEGPVKVVGYSTEHDFSVGSEQYSFLEKELLSSDRKRTPWLVVVGHRPIYIDSNFSGRAAPKGNVAPPAATEAPLNASDVAVSRDLREQLEPLFLKAGVDATFHGHHHSWQRTCATDGSGECVFDAENNDGGGVVAGAGSSNTGGGERVASSSASASKNQSRRNATVHFVIGHAGGDFTDGSLQVPTPPLFQSVEFQHGHARLRADGAAMTVEAVRASDGKVFDSVTLRKRSSGGGGGGNAEETASSSSSSSAVPPPPSASSPPSLSQQAAGAAGAARAVATASTKEETASKKAAPRLLLSQRRILLRGGDVAAAVAAATVLSG